MRFIGSQSKYFILIILLAICLIAKSFNIYQNLRYKSINSQLYSQRSDDISFSNFNNSLEIRKIGSYEKLLNRKQPKTGNLALSHGCLVQFNDMISNENLVNAVSKCMRKHPILHSYIAEDIWINCKDDLSVLAYKVVKTNYVDSSLFDEYLKHKFEVSINDLKFQDNLPLWRIENVISSDKLESAWIFSFNHAVDDQQSINILITDILHLIENNRDINSIIPKSFPNSIERGVSSRGLNLNTIRWAILQLWNSLQNPIVLPFHIMKKLKNDESFALQVCEPINRSTATQFFTLSKEDSTKFFIACKEHNCTVTNTLSAIILCLTALLMEPSNESVLKLRFLLSVGLRKFGYKNGSIDWTNETVCSAAGAIDYVVDVSRTARRELLSESSSNYNAFWELTKICQKVSKRMIETNEFIPESVQLFDFGMNAVDIFKAVDLESKSMKTLGRGYSCSVSNVGQLNIKDIGSFKATSIYYATSQSCSGVLVQLSCMTMNGKFFGCLQFLDPIISQEEMQVFKIRFKEILQKLV